MRDWKFTPRDFKNYPHFDKPIPLKEVEALVKDPERVRKHGFFPFLRYEKKWQPFRKQGRKPNKKVRVIRYAARSDAYIYAYYRHLLSEPYEELLAEHGLGDCVIAYRKIRAGDGEHGGKCNIHFADEAFSRIARMGNCCAVALDISKFFESLDHARLREIWRRLLGQNDLPADQEQVFKHITQYAEAERERVYEKLGYSRRKQNGSWEYVVDPRSIPMQLCSPTDFRAKICDSKLIKKNTDEVGIPQGSAISDLLANAYLLDFDICMKAYVMKRGGFYMRYSDDILIVVPGDGRAGRAARAYARRTIEQCGDKLEIKEQKANTVKFKTGSAGLAATWIVGGRRTNGLEYLGFRFDGEHIYLRDSTLANLNRKITRAVRAVAHRIVARYPGKDAAFLRSQFDVNRFMQRYGRVEDFDENQDYREWTFWSYARRAAEIMGIRGRNIYKQLSSQKRQVCARAERELHIALLHRLKDQSRTNSRRVRGAA